MVNPPNVIAHLAPVVAADQLLSHVSLMPAFLLNLAASCSSFSCQINFSLKLAALPLQALLSQLSLSKGLLLCYLLLSFPSKALLCPMDNL